MPIGAKYPARRRREVPEKEQGTFGVQLLHKLNGGGWNDLFPNIGPENADFDITLKPITHCSAGLDYCGQRRRLPPFGR